MSSGSVDKERDDDGAIVAVSGSDMADPSHGLKIVRIPGITAQQAGSIIPQCKAKDSTPNCLFKSAVHFGFVRQDVLFIY